MSTPKAGKSNAGAAATHSGGMRAEAKKTKVVFKNVLDTPFNIPWPEVTSENNAIVLDVLCDLMKPIRDHRRSGRKTKSSISKKDFKPVPDASSPTTVPQPSVKDIAAKSSKPKRALAIINHDPQQPQSVTSAEELQPIQKESTPTERPAILKSTTIGINAVTKSLERSIQDLKRYPPPRAVFLCKGDLAPSHLYNHLGPMIAMLPDTTLLFPLLRGSEKRLSEALGMQAVGALAIHAHINGESDIDAGSLSRETEDLIMILGRMVEPMSVSWLPKVLPPVPKLNKSKEDITKKSTPTPAPVMTKESALSSTNMLVTSAPASQTSLTAITTSVLPQSTSPSVLPSTATATVKDTTSRKWIPTNIKNVQTTMPIIVKTPRPVAGDTPTSSSDNGKKKGQQQQQQQQKQQQQPKSQKPQQPPRQKQGQADPSSKKHRMTDDASRYDQDKNKKSKNI
ncbi:hypothetical protein BGZ68_001264 [Mortierella alpina]|nr:hypothetical protein BGZ68_001264 [Mortierella alpina]